MDWIAQIEKRKFIIVGGILLIAFAALLVTSLRSPVAFDSFWHLQMGKDWLENGLSPWTDHYSFTYYGHTITNPPVIFQGLLHLVVSQFGVRTGLLVVRLGAFLLTIGAVLLLLKRMKASAVVYVIVIPMIVFLLQMRAIVRPELFSYAFSVIALMLYFRADNKISTQNLLPMIALMLVWSIYHTSIVGYVIFFGFFLDCAVAQFESRAPRADWIRWFMWGVLIVAVGFLNPGFSHPLIQVITFPSEWKILILEYQPTAVAFKSFAAMYVLMFLAVLTPVMAFKQRQFGILIVWAVLIYGAVMMQRMVTPSGIIIVLLTAKLLIDGKVFHWLKSVGNNYQNKLIWFVLLGSIGVTLYSNVERARYFMKENQGLFGRYPIAIADYMIERQMSGRIFNSYARGGYLIYRLTPQNQVYIDGRTQILYPLEHMKRYEKVINSRDSGILREELDKYSIDQIIWEHSQVRHDLVQDMGGFGLDFLDARLVLYTRGTSNFPILGKLLSRPECWQPDMLDQLNSERKKMDYILPEYSPLFPFANLVVGYSNADNGKAFFDANINGDEWFDEMRRFAGYRFLETGEYDLVGFLLGGVEIHKPKDYLASALAKIKAGDVQFATRILDDFSNAKWPKIKPQEAFIQYKLYQLISMHRDLTSVEQKIEADLKVKLINLQYTNLDSEFVIDTESFCTSSEN